jgi:hypothetical protein
MSAATCGTLPAHGILDVASLIRATLLDIAYCRLTSGHIGLRESGAGATFPRLRPINLDADVCHDFRCGRGSGAEAIEATAGVQAAEAAQDARAARPEDRADDADLSRRDRIDHHLEKRTALRGDDHLPEKDAWRDLGQIARPAEAGVLLHRDRATVGRAV